LAEELLNNYTPVIDGLTMIPSGKGRFEVVVDGDLIYSKAETGRHAEAGEVNGLFVKKTGAEAAPLS